MPTIDASSLREAQQADPELKKILDAFDAGDPEITAPWTSRGYLCSQGILYRYSPDDDVEEAQLVIPHDLRTIVTQENFVPEVTPRLLRLADTLDQARETHEKEQNRRKAQADSRRRPSPGLSPGDYVYVTSHTLSSSAHHRSSKLTPKRDGPYLILRQQGPCSYQIAHSNQPTEPIGVYHVSALTPYRPPEDSSNVPAPLPAPLLPIRRRGRPRKVTTPTTTEPSTRTTPRL